MTKEFHKIIIALLRVVRTQVATLSFIGLLPMPGTAASFCAASTYFVLSSRFEALSLFIFLSFIPFLIGWFVAGSYESAAGKQDPSEVVIDEFVGQTLALSILQTLAQKLTFCSGLVCFVLFRLIDIFKPWPVCWIDRNVKGGLGIMLDDVLAGLLAGVLTAFFGSCPS